MHKAATGAGVCFHVHLLVFVGLTSAPKIAWRYRAALTLSTPQRPCDAMAGCIWFSEPIHGSRHTLRDKAAFSLLGCL